MLGQDATTENYFRLLELAGYVGHGMQGTCAEASVAALLSLQAEGALCELSGIKLMHQPSAEDWRQALAALPVSEQVVVMTGENGQPENDALYADWLLQFMPSAKTIRYKQWFGECFTASALGCYTAAQLIHAGKYEQILLVNTNRAGDASLTLLSR